MKETYLNVRHRKVKTQKVQLDNKKDDSMAKSNHGEAAEILLAI